ncbi:MAG: type 1 glutamine amidotransferase domain-containing protein [Burkholderiaceae bacterium]
MSKKVLFITTSNNVMGASGKPTGLWLEELAAPYYAFKDAGVEVTLASPKGGAAPFDAGSVKPIGQNPATVDRFLQDAAAMQAAQTTLRVADVKAAEFDAVFFPGGHGTMWDLPQDAAVARAVGSAFDAGKVVASVCHGAAGLVGAKKKDGTPVVAGLRVNSFTDAEEDAAGLTGVVPFALESRLRELGGKFEGAANWQAFAVSDGQLITGQNPASSEKVAQLVLAALGMKA